MEVIIVILILAGALAVVGWRIKKICCGGDACSGCTCQDACHDKADQNPKPKDDRKDGQEPG